MDKEILTVENKLWMQLAIILGIPAFLFLSGFMVWSGVDKLSTSLSLSLFMIGMGIWFFIVTLKGMPLLRFLKHRLVLFPEGIEIKRGNVGRMLLWDQIGSIKENDTYQVLRIYDKSGRLVYAVDYYAENFYEFMGYLRR